MIIEEKVREMLKGRQWTFADLQDMNAVVMEMVENLYDKISAKDKLDMIWKSETTHAMSYNTLDNEMIPMPFGVLFQGLVKDELTARVIEVVTIELMNANVNFNGGNKNEVSEGSMGGQSLEERSSDEKTDSEE
tara:strand:- start:303 stop:704 length:402 start_codon:yes stop_codon:yes gene_type:complete